MASMHPSTATNPVALFTRQRLPLLVLLVISLVSTTIAIVALQRQPVVPESPAPAPAVSVPAPSVPVAPVTDRQAAIIDAYQQLHDQRLAAAQALRAGNTEAYEIAVSGAEALQSRLASLQAQQQAGMQRDQAIMAVYEELHLQLLAAEQALRAGRTEAYEIAVSGAEALQSRLADLQAQR